MKLSKYDSNHDGICDAGACKSIFTVTGDRAVDKGMIPSSTPSLKSIGLNIKERVLKDAYTAIQTPRKNIPFSTRARLGQGLRRRPARSSRRCSTAGRSSRRATRTTRSLGITPRDGEEARGQGQRRPAFRASTRTSTSAGRLVGDARITCYAELDKKLMYDDRAWVPYLWSQLAEHLGKNVTQYEYDQFGGTVAYAHVAVK